MFTPSCNVVQEQSQTRPLVLISGFIHDVGAFLDEHPGGRHLLAKQIGKDASTAFFGGVYEHSNAAHNVSSIRQAHVQGTAMADCVSRPTEIHSCCL